MKIIYSILGFLFVVVLVMRISSTPQSCLVSEAGDSESFANASAINDKYLAVGDPEANRVVIYTRDAKGKWLRSREILPPKGSEAEAIGFGFGYDVALDGSTLVIGVYGSKYKPNNPEDITYKDSDGVWLNAFEVYKTTLDNVAEIKRIDIDSEEEIPSGLVLADNGKIVYSTLSLQKDVKSKVYLYEDGNIKNTFVSPTDTKHLVGRTASASSIALKNDFLIVDSPGEEPRGAAWLFSLKAPSAKPRKLTIPNQGSREAVAISEHFAAVGVRNPFFFSSNETLVVSMEDGSTNLVEGVGKLSSDGNILAMMLPYVSRGGYTQESLLRVYDLTNINAPRLIAKQGGINNAYVQNNFLTTIKKNYSEAKTKICIEQITK